MDWEIGDGEGEEGERRERRKTRRSVQLKNSSMTACLFLSFVTFSSSQVH